MLQTKPFLFRKNDLKLVYLLFKLTKGETLIASPKIKLLFAQINIGVNISQIHQLIQYKCNSNRFPRPFLGYKFFQYFKNNLEFDNNKIGPWLNSKDSHQGWSECGSP